MTIPFICYITMEDVSPSKSMPVFSFCHFLIHVLLLQTIPTWVWAEKKNSDFEPCKQQTCSSEKNDDSILSRGDAEIVMEKLGIFCSSEDAEELQERLNSNELSGLFDEKEPSLEEVKEAFDVFDENRDGFIDGRELQRVLCILGLEEGKELVNCNKMIRKFDENSDGRIDFNEFIKFMEKSLAE